MEESIEINFRLDPDGRISLQKEENGQESDHVTLPISFYQPKSTQGSFSRDFDTTKNNNKETQRILDDLLFDAEIADSGLMPRTFWVPATDPSENDPAVRCSFEQLAMDVFHHHVPSNLEYNTETSGAEWWVQIRPSPSVGGRYSMLMDDNDPMTKAGISFHWDKDEDLRILCGGNTYVHPHLSTVTYLTDWGAPTCTMSARIHSLTGEYLVKNAETDTVDGFVCWPKTGKHLSFDGRYLHAAPVDLMRDNEFQDQISFSPDPDSGKNKLLERRHRRVTFLVNVWLNYKPFGVERFPMVEKMSGITLTERARLVLTKENSDGTTEPECVVNLEKEDESMKIFVWPLGNEESQEYIKALIPIERVREGSSQGSNLRLTWTGCAFELPFSKEKFHSPTSEGNEKRDTQDKIAVKKQKIEER